MSTYCLVSIVKNESNTIGRLLRSVLGIVNDYVIVDTGSDDDTVEVIQESALPGKVFHRPFDNFCNSRNHALECARATTRSDFLLLLDADMELRVPDASYLDAFRGDVFDLVQTHGNLTYRNVRIVRRDIPAKYVGVTHEYIDIPPGHKTESAPKDKVYIHDVGDGGSKFDKFERDIRLLTEGLREDPANIRYHFYLANSYHHVGQHETAIDWYRKRIALGGWEQEVIYSKYMIVKCLIDLHRLDDALVWLEESKVYEDRAEPAYHMCRAFRERGDYHRALFCWSMTAKHDKTPDEHNALFLEQHVYDYLLAFELSILWYFVFPKDRKHGLKVSYDVLSVPEIPDHIFKCAHDNLMFYARPIGGNVEFRQATEYEPGWYYTTPSLCQDHTLYRVVNYKIDDEGRYIVKDPDNVVRTRNVWDGRGELRVAEAPHLPRHADAVIMGLEDLRLTTDPNGTHYALCATMEYGHIPRAISQMLCRLDSETLTIHPLALLSDGTRCEKNWCFAGWPHFIYEWYPVTIKTIVENETRVVDHCTLETPDVMRYMRGSSNGVLYRGQWWFVTHSVIQGRSGIRRYLHYLVVLAEDLSRVDHVSYPFTFEENADIEYCISLQLHDEGARFGYSVRDGSPMFRAVGWVDVYKVLTEQSTRT